MTDLGQACWRNVQAAFGVGESGGGLFPVVGNPQRLKKILSSIVVNVLAGGLLEDVGEKLRHAAAVDKNFAGLGGHGLVNDVLHPVVVGLHYVAGIFGIV